MPKSSDLLCYKKDQILLEGVRKELESIWTTKGETVVVDAALSGLTVASEEIGTPTL